MDPGIFIMYCLIKSLTFGRVEDSMIKSQSLLNNYNLIIKYSIIPNVKYFCFKNNQIILYCRNGINLEKLNTNKTLTIIIVKSLS